MDRCKKKERNYCQGRNICPLVAALGRGERRGRGKMPTENPLLKNMTVETGFKTFNGKTRPK